MYSNCIDAVKNHKKNNSNVDTDKSKIKCQYDVSTCVIVGNTDPLYACCENGPKSPQRVYSEGMRFKDFKEVKQ